MVRYTRVKAGVNENRPKKTYAQQIRERLVPKVPNAGEYHRHLAFVSGSNHFFVANRAARLNSAGCASFGRSDQPVREWEKSVARDRAAFERKPSFVRFPNRNARSVDSRHLAGANSKCPVRLGVYDGV